MSTPERTGVRKPTKSAATPAAKTTSLKLPTELKERLQKVADSQRRSSHWVMLEAIENHVSRVELREQLRKDAEEAWRDYEETGLHLTGKEVNEWLRRRAKGEDVEMPEPHT
jgi:predicted transcriptional regulator